MQHQRNLPHFFLTVPTPCVYLPGKTERKVFTQLIGKDAAIMNDSLSEGGFRRSQMISYRPACLDCQACISLRIVVKDFKPSKTHRKIIKRNQDLMGKVLPPRPTSEQYSLFKDYLHSRHEGGGMVDMTMLDYSLMVEESHVRTRIIEYKKRGIDSAILKRGTGDLYAVAVCDELADGISLVYSYFNPEEPERSLGTMMILDTIERARELGLPYVYLGYWIEKSDKMNYKANFKPHEILVGSGWKRVD
jgi:leucyl-tRNA---protein transferase